MLKQIRRLRSRARKLLTADPTTAAAAQIALAEAAKSATIENPRQALSFFIDCFEPVSIPVVFKTPRIKHANIDRVLATLQFRDATVPLSVALPVAQFADRMQTNFTSEGYSGDIGYHFSVSSSLGPKARLVFNLVRAAKPKACLEIGTAYGISAYLIARCQELCGITANVATIENYSPQKEISRAFLETHCPPTVRTFHADKHDAFAKLAAASEQFDFVFHDNGHSGDHYVRDFAAILPLMPDGAVFVLDDINWFGHGQGESKRTCYEGWLEIIRHPRVAAAIEIRDSTGVIFLR